MAVSQIEEKILGRLARQTAPSSPLLSASLYQVLGLSILLSRRLYRARKLRKLDTTRDTKSLQLYHHIIWLAREGLSITEAYVLPHCQNGEEGPECRVMAAKLRASFYHVFCLYHNHPPISQLSARSAGSESTASGILSPQDTNPHNRQSPRKKSPKNAAGGADAQRRPGNTSLRDAIPSITSETSYVTNPFAFGPTQTPPPPGPPPPIPTDARRTPTRPPGLEPINISATQAAASFLLPPLNFVPMTRDHFETAQQLANTLLSAANALRLTVSLEHAAFLWDCDKAYDRARRLARKTIKEVYKSPEGLDDDEFADASALVQNLGGIVRRGTQDPTPQPSLAQLSSSGAAPMQRPQRTPPHIDRTIAISPPERKRSRTLSPAQSIGTAFRSGERLSTVIEETSRPPTTSSTDLTTQMALSPPVSRLSNRSRPRRPSSATSDKASKRRAVEAAEDRYRQDSASRAGSRGSSNPSSSGRQQQTEQHSRQATPPEGTSHDQDTSANVTPSKKSKHWLRREKRKDKEKSGGAHDQAASPKDNRTAEKSTTSNDKANPLPMMKKRAITKTNEQPQRQRNDTAPTTRPRARDTRSERFEPMYRHSETHRSHRDERRDAILTTLEIVSAVRSGLRIPSTTRSTTITANTAAARDSRQNVSWRVI